MSDALTQLLKQAEAQKIELEMNILLSKNLALFQALNPKLFARLSTYKPNTVVPHLDPNGNINLVDKNLRQYFYNPSPKEYCQAQVEGFAKLQRIARFTVNENKEYNAKHIHIPHLNKLLQKYKSNPTNIVDRTEDFVSSLLVTGVGLGYHLPLLMENYSIQNIFIYENCMDTFYASLQTLDWEPIFEYFMSERRSITFSVGESAKSALEKIEANLHNLGLHNHSYSFIYPHSQRDCEKEFVSLYMREMRSYLGGLGYFDDEQIGLAHAFHNLHRNAGMFSGRQSYNRKTRLLVIGNGPSLDFHKDYLLKHQEDMVIMTCGTALGPVLKMGIKPDFHIEMERTNATTGFLTYNISPQDIKGIPLLCLHTVSPNTLDIFDEVFLAIKPLDAGTSLVENYYQEEKPALLYFCNPTVTNCCLAYAVNMGFKDIHLIGVDLGFSKEGEHHSKNSVHYELEEKAKNKGDFRYGYSDKAPIETKGNFEDKVKTHPVLNGSRVSMERVLRIANQLFNDFNCYNSNNGVFIEGTISCKLEDMPAPAETNKKAEVEAVKRDCFIHKENKAFFEKKPEDYLHYLFKIEKDFYLKSDLKNDMELFREMQRLYNMISCAKDPITNRLLKGSINTFFGAIVEYTAYRKNPEDFRRNLEIGTKAFNDFVANMYAIMHEDPFRIDDTHDPIISKIKQKA